MSITAIVENGSVRLPIHVPDGTQVEIVVPEPASSTASEASGSFFDSVRGLIGSVEGAEDWAAEHDHYAHGTPKRGQS